MNADLSPEAEPPIPTISNKADRVLSLTAWIIAIGLVIFASYLGWRIYSSSPLQSVGAAYKSAQSIQANIPTVGQISADNSPEIPMPELQLIDEAETITRRSTLQTIIPNRPGYAVRQYSVKKGDSVFEIASKFSIQPETVLWEIMTS